MPAGFVCAAGAGAVEKEAREVLQTPVQPPSWLCPALPAFLAAPPSEVLGKGEALSHEWRQVVECMRDQEKCEGVKKVVGEAVSYEEVLKKGDGMRASSCQ